MRGHRLVPIVLVGVLAFHAASPIAQGQRRRSTAPPESPRRTFADRIEVRVVNLEAVVVDKAGDRVSGLAPGDFVLEVDGKPTPIGYFSEVEDGVAVETELPTLDGGAMAAPAGISPGEAVGTSYLVFIDSYFTTHAARRNRILDEIESQLLRLGPNDRIALVAFGGRKLEVLSGWSRSEPELARAFDRARSLRARGLMTDAVASQVDRDRGREAAIVAAAATQDTAFSDGTTAPTVTGAVRQDGLPSDICNSIRVLESRVRREVLAVTAALRSFAKPPGRKVMIVLSGGWPNSVKEYLVSTAGPFAAGECKAEGPKIYRPIYDTANRLGYTLYPVDVPAPDGPSINASSSGAALFGESPPIGPVGATTQFDRQFEVHTTLQRMAAETGGRALLDGASLSAFDRVIGDTRSYYWLGFTPEWKGNDKAHDVKLKVSRPGLKIRSRKGFLDFSRQTEVSFVTESALLFGDLPGSSRLGLEFGPLPEKGKRRLEIPIRLSIPLDQVAMFPVGDTYIAELELRIGVLDESGNRNEMPVIPVTLEGVAAPEPGSHAIYETTIRMRSQNHDIVISIYDPLSDTVMAATGRIGSAGEGTVPAP